MNNYYIQILQSTSQGRELWIYYLDDIGSPWTTQDDLEAKDKLNALLKTYPSKKLELIIKVNWETDVITTY